MRYLATAVLVLILGAPASAAEYWQSDNLLSCLVGKGVVALRHGETPAEAMASVTPDCKKQEDPPPPKGQDGADYTQFVYATALQVLEQAADAI